ncbi:thiamine pyrophosphate-dependent acetolactate synthase large subunit-like protein [Paenarthrobacter nicotinovorans]|uniref:Thiamine pyrophosphate-dependent acetolactate synthase large subunit-like protein n=1 Tax=Paenarthrobacter nicotinovorans TaxID=29320 RepID=A0ABT9TNB5_PAENI|nr:thiamine pyrophosphate-binding protein [Paenarthrobacter nicotinovorans]MDQ0103173.1 thiamine pyrophosphate-dependent acetolactate synthase large subunit-like protein [Paenarthrobacter nicotinovorans]
MTSTDAPPVGTTKLPDEGNVAAIVGDVVAERAGHLFGLMGNGNVHLISRLTRRGFPFTSARHESATVAMADGYYRATGDIAAATTTYGAGFTNAYTTLAEARIARIPLVLVVGDAPSTGPRFFDIEQSKAADAVGVVTLVATPDNAEAITHRAFDLALQTVQPVVLAIPYDLATAPPSEAATLEPLPVKPAWPAEPADVERIAGLLATAKRPLILGGRGVLLADAVAPLRDLGDRLGALFMTSVMAVNAFASPWDLGIAGGFTRRHRLEVARQADVVLVVGASQNLFQTRYGNLFPPTTTIIRVDNEPDPGNLPSAEYIRADIRPFLESLLSRTVAATTLTWRDQAPEVASPAFRSSRPSEDPTEFGPDGRLNPRAVVAALDRILPAERSVVMDGGHFIGWAPMYLSVPDPQAMILVGTAFQAIGIGFGSAAGVSVARPERTTVLVSGDGGGLMGLADFETFLRATRRGVIVVLNDSAYGAELHQYAVKGLHEEAMLIDEVDFAALGRALGSYGTKVRTLAELQQLQDWLAHHEEGVFVLDIAISQKVVADYMSESVAAKG